MDSKEFDLLLDSMFEDIKELSSTKGREYTGGSPDRLDNFRQVAREAGITDLQAWLVFANKHYRSIQTYMRAPVSSNQLSEPMRSRFLDLILYSILGYALVVEHQRNMETFD